MPRNEFNPSLHVISTESQFFRQSLPRETWDTEEFRRSCGKPLNSVFEESFAWEYACTRNLTQAYKTAALISGRKNKWVGPSGYTMLNRDDVQLRIAEIVAYISHIHSLDMSSHMEELYNIRESAKANGKWAVALAAEIARGRVAGLYVKKVEHSTKNLNDQTTDQLEAQLKALQEKQTPLIEHQPDMGELVDEDSTEDSEDDSDF